MFLGLSSLDSVKGAHDYESAQAVLAKYSKTPTGRARTRKAQGYPLNMSSNTGVTWVRDDPDGTINFRLYDTDVVVWHPDNSVEIENYGTVTTSKFARSFLPAGVYLNHRTETRGHRGGNSAIRYATGEETITHWDGEVRAYPGKYHLCQGSVVRFRQHEDNVWLPDEDTLDEMQFLEITADRRQRAELAKTYHLKDFAQWLPMAAHHLELEHDGWDLDECADALQARDFRKAAEYLPTVTISNGWGAAERIKPLPIAVSDRNSPITMGSLNKLKLALLEREGLVETVKRVTISCDEYDKLMRTTREVVALGGGGYRTYGAA